MEELYRRKAKRRLAAVLLYLVLLIGCALFFLRPGKGRTVSDDVLEIHFLSVGKADCILLRTGEHAMLIDAGWENTSKQVRRYLNDQGITSIDYAVATHEDEDHIGGMEEVLRRFRVAKLLVPPVEGQSEMYQDMLLRAGKRQTQVKKPEIPSSFSFGKAEVMVIAPGTAALADGQRNNSSLVLYLTFGKRSFLFMGDALKASEEEILREGYRIRADVLKAGHHGFDDATEENFLETVAPKLVVITRGEETKDISSGTLQKGEETKDMSSGTPGNGEETKGISSGTLEKAAGGSMPFGNIEPLLAEQKILYYYTGDGTLILTCDGEKIEAMR